LIRFGGQLGGVAAIQRGKAALNWWAQLDLNQRPDDYESDFLLLKSALLC